MTLDLKNFFKSRGPLHQDVLGVDIGASATKAVRLRVVDGQVRLVAAAQWPLLPFPAADAPVKSAPLAVPHALHARHVALALSPPSAVAKLLIVPRAANNLADFAFAGMLGLAQPDKFRIGIEVESSSHNETTVLAAALPEYLVKWAISLFPVATPTPCAVEIAGLAALNAIMHSLRAKPEDHAVMAIDIGAQTSTFAIFIRENLALLRQFPIGAGTVMARVASSLGMDEETARNVLSDDAIDASDAIHEALDPLMRQLVLGRDFVARHRNCRVGSVYLSGGLASTPFWRRHIASLLGFEANDWNPLTSIPSEPDTVSPELMASANSFTAALGAAWGALEAS
jgi:Tfp pilus assembly PilM family ATPase